MLKPRRANIVEIRASAPGLSSTMTLRVRFIGVACRACSSGSSYSTISSAAAPAGIIGKHCSDWSTRQSTTAVRPERERLLQRRRELVLGVDGDPERAVGLGEACVVGHLMRQVDVRAAAVEEHVLPLLHHAEVAVVDEHDDDRQVLEHGGRRAPARSSGSSRRRRRRRPSPRGAPPWRRSRPGSRSPSSRARPT